MFPIFDRLLLIGLLDHDPGTMTSAAASWVCAGLAGDPVAGAASATPLGRQPRIDDHPYLPGPASATSHCGIPWRLLPTAGLTAVARAGRICSTGSTGVWQQLHQVLLDQPASTA